MLRASLIINIMSISVFPSLFELKSYFITLIINIQNKLKNYYLELPQKIFLRLGEALEK